MPPEAIFLIEREVKLVFPTAATARAAVFAIGAVPARARRLQDDTLYDTSGDVLRKKGSVIRVRTERWSDGNDSTTLTVKGPVQPGQMKVREEHETRVEQAEALMHAFGALGLRPWFRYQKYREEFSAEGVVIAIDETPVGTYVELEGDEGAIHAVTSALGRSPADFILDSYYRLFMKRRDELGLTGPHMIFRPT
jgi:adenylate cyclase class 2